jgi:hypothetical protein
MDSLELPPVVERHTFYLSSCESGTGIDIRDSNVSSRNSSTSSFSSSNVGTSTARSSIHTNIFLDALKRLYCLKLRHQKHGRYRTLSSSLDLFFKKHQHPSINEFYKSPSSPLLSTITTDMDKNFITRKTNSHHQLHAIETNKTKHSNIKNRRSLLRRVRASDKTVSEDNNTNTMSSWDLASLIPTVLITESNSSATISQQAISIDIKRVSQLFLSISFPSLDIEFNTSLESL